MGSALPLGSVKRAGAFSQRSAMHRIAHLKKCAASLELVIQAGNGGEPVWLCGGTMVIATRCNSQGEFLPALNAEMDAAYP